MNELMNLKFTSEWWMLVFPLLLMVLDILTGYYNAWEHSRVSSSKMRDGLGKKCAELCYIIVGFLFKFAFGTSSIAFFIVIYVCYMELVSLAENCTRLGFPLPEKLKEKLNNKESEDK